MSASPRKLKIRTFWRPSLRGRRWYFRIVGRNGEIVAQSEAYHNRVDAIATAEMIRNNLFEADIT